MKNRLPFRLLFLMTLVLFACKSEDEVPVTPSTPVVIEPVDTIIPNGDEQYLTLKSDYIFDQDKIPTFELTLPDAALAKIDADPTAEEYVDASLTFEGETISPVGLRYKGSIGAYVGCVSGSDWANPSGRKTCTKLSMKVKLNWTEGSSKFYGLKKLQLHSMNNDPSQMRERLGYWLFREMGVAAPRAIHARLLINGTFVGLFALVEQIDGRFARYHFDDGDGNVYKEVWPLSSSGQAQAEQVYLNQLKTNEDENPSAAMIRTFAQEVVQANGNELQNTVKKWMDIETVLAYAAVDRTIRNDDGAFHWYCDGNSCSNHNYYWYEEPTANRLHLIPWDLDHAFVNIISNTNPVTPIADAWGEITDDCQTFRYGLFGFTQRSAACDKLTGAWASFTNEYEQTLIDFKTGPFSEAQVTARLDAWEAQVREATTTAQADHGDAISVNEWEEALNQLRQQLEYARK